eukprot:TRINITY_DN8816_c0_g1_i2.p1 TRINITY_DN8816_c0_g1~~TRINITY_DN8816_c0_g1_i2.p1  ORF type:complete len:1706 (+),score=323.73 TRINITY_DN8816_c0_g1_i2:91-5208(+)
MATAAVLIAAALIFPATATPTSAPTAFPSPAPTSFPTFTPTAGPTASPTSRNLWHLSFDEGSGTEVADGQGAVNVTLSEDSAWNEEGIHGGALTLSSVHGNVSASALWGQASAATVAWMAWVKRTEQGQVSRTILTVGGISMSIRADGKAQCTVADGEGGNSTATATTPETAELGTWHFVLCTFTGSTSSVAASLDFQTEATTTATLSAVSLNISPGTPVLGQLSAGPAVDVDEIFVYGGLPESSIYWGCCLNYFPLNTTHAEAVESFANSGSCSNVCQYDECRFQTCPGTAQVCNDTAYQQEPSTKGDYTCMEAPTASPTTVPSNSPTAVPTSSPTTTPTNQPTTVPTESPTQQPSSSPTAQPTPAPPTQLPSQPPSFPAGVTAAPSTATEAPSGEPTTQPSAVPSKAPSAPPTGAPSAAPSGGPLASPPSAGPFAPGTPSVSPVPATSAPTSGPSVRATGRPTTAPPTTRAPPTRPPRPSPTRSPLPRTASPTKPGWPAPPSWASWLPFRPMRQSGDGAVISPSRIRGGLSIDDGDSGTQSPGILAVVLPEGAALRSFAIAPSTRAPTVTLRGTSSPTEATGAPSPFPSAATLVSPPSSTPKAAPSSAPKATPSSAPKLAPSGPPTTAPSEVPSAAPSQAPTQAPTVGPTVAPSVAPTVPPTFPPSEPPSRQPISAPTAAAPTVQPTASQTEEPTVIPAALEPTLGPTESPTAHGTPFPTDRPTGSPSRQAPPTAAPSLQAPSPTSAPSAAPTAAVVPPTLQPTGGPTTQPSTSQPTVGPTTQPTGSPTPSTAAPSEQPAPPTATPTAGPTSPAPGRRRGAVQQSRGAPRSGSPTAEVVQRGQACAGTLPGSTSADVAVTTNRCATEAPNGFAAVARRNPNFIRVSASGGSRPSVQLSLQDPTYDAHPDGETIEFLLLPGLFRSDQDYAAACAPPSTACAVRFFIKEEGDPETHLQSERDTATAVAVPATAGVTLLAANPAAVRAGGSMVRVSLLSRQMLCPTSGPDELDITLNPLQMRFRLDDYAEYRGATLGVTIIMFSCAAVCFIVYHARGGYNGGGWFAYCRADAGGRRTSQDSTATMHGIPTGTSEAAAHSHVQLTCGEGDKAEQKGDQQEEAQEDAGAAALLIQCASVPAAEGSYRWQEKHSWRACGASLSSVDGRWVVRGQQGFCGTQAGPGAAVLLRSALHDGRSPTEVSGWERPGDGDEWSAVGVTVRVGRCIEERLNQGGTAWMHIPVSFLYGAALIGPGTLLIYDDEDDVWRLAGIIVLLAFAVTYVIYAWIWAARASDRCKCLPKCADPWPAGAPTTFVGRFFFPTREWVPRPGNPLAEHVAELHGMLFDGYHSGARHWLGFEIAVTIVLGTMAVWQPEDVVGCRVRAGVMAGAFVVFFLALVALRPYLAPYENWVEGALAFLEASVGVLTFAAMVDDGDEEHPAAVTAGNIGLTLIFGVVGKFCLDVFLFLYEKFAGWQQETDSGSMHRDGGCVGKLLRCYIAEHGSPPREAPGPSVAEPTQPPDQTQDTERAAHEDSWVAAPAVLGPGADSQIRAVDFAVSAGREPAARSRGGAPFGSPTSPQRQQQQQGCPDVLGQEDSPANPLRGPLSDPPPGQEEPLGRRASVAYSAVGSRADHPVDASELHEAEHSRPGLMAVDGDEGRSDLGLAQGTAGPAAARTNLPPSVRELSPPPPPRGDSPWRGVTPESP